jgi:hypothetical protein
LERTTLYKNPAVCFCSCTLGLAAMLAFTLGAGCAFAQAAPPASQDPARQPAPPSNNPEHPSPAVLARLPEQTRQNPHAPCIQPPPGVSWQDYQGPFAKTVGVFARRLERRSVRTPHYKAGAMLCTLEVKDKFVLFVADSLDPASFLTAGFNAGISQAENDDPAYGQGARGYATRFGANMAGNATSGFFKDFAYPTIFAEDPRYYRLGEGSNERRFFHALQHAYLAHRVNGTHMFNFSELLGTTSAVLVSNTYHPNNPRGVGPTTARVSISIASDAGYDVLREFWPEVARKFKLPFREQHEPVSAGAAQPQN